MAEAQGIMQHIDPFTQKQINRGNIYELLANLPGQFSKQDLMDHMKTQHMRLQDLVKNHQLMSGKGQVKPPTQMMKFNAKFAMSQDDISDLMMMLFQQKAQAAAKGDKAAMKDMMMMGGRGGKFAMAPQPGKGAKAAKDADKPVPPMAEEIIASSDMTYQEAMDFVFEMQNRMFELQCQLDMEKKHEELKQEVQRIIEMVRSGKVDAVFLLIALAKVNASKNGLLFTQFGKKLWKLNDEATRVTEELYSGDPMDPQYAAQLQMTAQKQKAIGFQQQFLIQDMQKVTQNIESVMSFAKQAIDDIYKTKMHIINAPFKGLG